MEAADLGEVLESKVIGDFRMLFYEITGMLTVLSFPRWRGGVGDCVPRNAKCRFCRLVHSTPRGVELCRVWDARNVERIRETGKACISSCHLGLVGVAAPVFLQGEFVGAVLSGDVLTRPPSDAGFARVRKAFADTELDLAELERAYREIPIVPRRTLHLASEMLSLIVNYIVDRERVISLQEEIYQKQREVAEAMAARGDLEKGLRAQMEEVRGLRGQLLAAMRGERPAAPPEGTHRKRVIDAALALIDGCYTEDVTLQDVAAHVRLSPNHLSALFRRECGCSFRDYVVRKRVARACELLHDTRLNVTEVGMRVGYCDPTYFSQVFKRVMGLSPVKYRNGEGATACGAAPEFGGYPIGD